MIVDLFSLYVLNIKVDILYTIFSFPIGYRMVDGF